MSTGPQCDQHVAIGCVETHDHRGKSQLTKYHIVTHLATLYKRKVHQ